MWFDQADCQSDWADAARHLAQADKRFGPILRDVGPCGLAPRRDYFVTLCKAIFNQQLSVAAAATVFGRFRDLFPQRRPTPHRVKLALNGAGNDERIRACGISRQKRGYLIDLADHFASGKIPSHRLARMTDEQVIETLTQVKGIGRWSAEMFLIFVLNRPDVWPVDDLGLQTGAQRFFGLRERPKGEKLIALGEPWRPWRSVATWYMWRSLAIGAQAQKKADGPGRPRRSHSFAPRRTSAPCESPTPA
jgi:DNA-3-methyladenine glycosylase II